MTFVVDSADARELPTRGAFLSANAHDFPARHLIVLSGPTGAGKTAILRALAARGAQVVDLEALACHRGSVFGGIGQPLQPSHSEFHARIASTWRAARDDHPLFIEDEGEYLGSVGLPLRVCELIRHADRVAIDTPKAARVSRLLSDYGGFPVHELATAVRRASLRLGGRSARAALEALARGDREAAIEALLPFYDRAYAHRTSSQQPDGRCLLWVDGADVQQATDAVLAAAASVKRSLLELTSGACTDGL